MEETVEPVVRAFRTSDSDLLVEGLRGADLQSCQLSRGPESSHLGRVILPQVGLDMVRLGPSMLFTGSMPRDCYTLMDVLACPQPGRSFNFELEHTDGYLGFFAPGGSLDAITPPGYRNMSLTVPIAVLHADLASHDVAAPDSLLAKGAGLRVGSEAQRSLRSLADSLWEMILDPTQPLAAEPVRQQAERALRATFINALIDGGERRFLPGRVRVTRRYQRLSQARDYLAAHAREPVYLNDVCGATGIGRRAMENLFRDLLGLTPAIYLRHQRLHGARRELRDAEPNSGVVKTVALQWGFWHLGRFAAEYHALFGENPSETLARPQGTDCDK